MSLPAPAEELDSAAQAKTEIDANPQDDLLLSLPAPAEELDSAAQAKTEIDPEKIKQVSEMLDDLAKEHERMKAVLG